MSDHTAGTVTCFKSAKNYKALFSAALATYDVLNRSVEQCASQNLCAENVLDMSANSGQEICHEFRRVVARRSTKRIDVFGSERRVTDL